MRLLPTKEFQCAQLDCSPGSEIIAASVALVLALAYVVAVCAMTARRTSSGASA